MTWSTWGSFPRIPPWYVLSPVVSDIDTELHLDMGKYNSTGKHNSTKKLNIHISRLIQPSHCTFRSTRT